MVMDAYERVVLSQIEAGLQLQNWRPGFHRLDRRSWIARRPALLAVLVASAAALLTLVLLGLASLAGSHGSAAASWLVVLLVLPALSVSGYLMLAQRAREIDAPPPVR